MNLPDIASRKYKAFIDIFNIKKDDERLDVLAGGATEYFIENMGEKEKKELLQVIMKYVKVAEKIRFSRRMEMKEQLLDPKDEEYKDLDVRSMNYMLEKCFNEPYKIIQVLENSTK